MFSHESSFLCSNSCSYQLNYNFQLKMYNKFNSATEEAQWLRLPGLGVWCVSNIMTMATRTSATAEVLLRGSGVLLSSPFRGYFLRDVEKGMREICVHAPKNILRLCFTPIEFVEGMVWLLIEPKHFTMDMVEYFKVNSIHANQGTLHSNEHKDDLGDIPGKTKPAFMEYQKGTRKRLQLNSSDTN